MKSSKIGVGSNPGKMPEPKMAKAMDEKPMKAGKKMSKKRPPQKL